MGVHFFFMISGFVISLTLRKTSTLPEFWKKRMIRLFPSMLLCSLITYLFTCSFDSSNYFRDSKDPLNMLVSFSFLNPAIWNDLFQLDQSYTSGSYWSLWPEIQFYLLSSLIFFLLPRKFATAIFLVISLIFMADRFFLNCNAINLLNVDTSNYIINRYMYWCVRLFNLPTFSAWFLAGILFYELYKSPNNTQWKVMLLFTGFLLFFSLEYWQEQAILLVMYTFFLYFIYQPQTLRFLTAGWLVGIGLSSYTLYLLQEVIGVLLIHRFATYLGPLDFLFPVCIILLLSGISTCIFRFFERPVGEWLKKKCL